jgi:hypothetical protein
MIDKIRRWLIARLGGVPGPNLGSKPAPTFSYTCYLDKPVVLNPPGRQTEL